MPVVNTRHAVVIIDDIDCTDVVSRAEVSSAESDSDFVSFAQAAAGGARDYTLGLTLAQNTSVATLWDLIWTQAGQDVEAEVWPNGKPVDSIPTAAQPQFLGMVTITEPDGVLLGGEASASTTARQVTEVEFAYLSKPTRNIGV